MKKTIFALMLAALIGVGFSNLTNALDNSSHPSSSGTITYSERNNIGD